MSNKESNADNQQGSSDQSRDPSETIRRTPLSNSSKDIKAYFLGAIHDGTFSSNKRFRICQKGNEWLIVLKELLKSIGYNSWIYKEGKDRSVYVLETLANFLDFNFNPLKLKSTQEKISYIRGFFDAEGGIPHNKDSRLYIQLAVKDKRRIKQIKTILNSLGIKSGKIHNPSINKNPDYWRIYVLSESKNKFIQEIGSWHPAKRRLLDERMMI